VIHSRRWLKLSATAIAASLATVTLTVSHANAIPSTAAEIESIQHAWSAIPENAGAPAIDNGRLADAAGHAVGGATVLAFPVPTNAKVGQRIVPLARATTDSAGRYTLRLPYARWGLLRSGKLDAYINIHVMAIYPGAVADFFTPVKLSARKPGTTDLVLSKRQFRAPGSISASGNTPSGASPDACVVAQSHVYSNVPMIIGYRSALTAARISYTINGVSTTASETTGVGISGTPGDEGFGGFSESGATTKSSTFSGKKTINGASNNDIQASTNWSNDLIQCSDAKGNVTEYWQAVYDSIATISGTPGAPAVAAGKCDTQASNTAETYESQTQQTWSAGVSLVSHIGIDLSAQSGLTSDSWVTYATTPTHSAPLCGTTNFPNAPGAPVGYLQMH
jgi:hypothetical protein